MAPTRMPAFALLGSATIPSMVVLYGLDAVRELGDASARAAFEWPLLLWRQLARRTLGSQSDFPCRDRGELSQTGGCRGLLAHLTIVETEENFSPRGRRCSLLMLRNRQPLEP